MENINWRKVRVQLCMPGYRYFDTTEKEHYEKTLWNISVVLINQSITFKSSKIIFSNLFN